MTLKLFILIIALLCFGAGLTLTLDGLRRRSESILGAVFIATFILLLCSPMVISR